MVNREYHKPICLGTGSSPLYPYEGMKRNRVEPVASISFKRGGCAVSAAIYMFVTSGMLCAFNSVCGDGFAYIPGTVKTFSNKRRFPTLNKL